MNEYFAGLVENYYDLKLESDKFFDTKPYQKAVNNQRRLASEFLRNPYEDLNGAGGHALEAILFNGCKEILGITHPKFDIKPAPAAWDYSKSEGYGFDYVTGVNFYEGQIAGYVSATLSRGNPVPNEFKRHCSGKFPPHIGLSSSIHRINHDKLASLCQNHHQEEAWGNHIKQISQNILTAFTPVFDFAKFHHW